MSFSKEALPMYIYETGEIDLNAVVIYLNSHQLALPKDGDYIIWYNSMYPDVSKYEQGDLDWLPDNVAMLIPTYVASQLLSTEDLQRSILLKNEFETMLSRIDDNKVLPSYSIENSSGWTL